MPLKPSLARKQWFIEKVVYVKCQKFMLFHCQKRLPKVYDDGSRDDSSSNSFTSVDVTEKEMCRATHESHEWPEAFWFLAIFRDDFNIEPEINLSLHQHYYTSTKC